MDNWPFEATPNTAVLTVWAVLKAHAPILLVTHDADDGGWQFLTGGTVTTADAAVVGLGEMCGRDPTLLELANLPEGWRAWPTKAGAPWQREPSESAS
ncbi:MAG TPA: hypothetical protein VES67_10465 [Vicinamibacterales bacterium]|nr:hypothetical protein [Vicinamibacterales bacterium]